MNLIPWRHKSEERAGRGVENPLVRFRQEFDQLFNQFFRDPWGGDLAERTFGVGPRMDLAETENEITLRFDLPGVTPEDVDISVSGGMLTLRGEKRDEKEQKSGDYVYAERSVGAFSRSVQLPSTVDPDKIDASYKNGVLTVTLAKHADAKPKRIPVRSA
jgi:HSP20 family protein